MLDSPHSRSALTYTANFVGGTVAGFNVAANGAVSLLDQHAATPGVDSDPTALALTQEGKYIHGFLRGTSGVNGWAIQQKNSLTDQSIFGVGGGLPVNNGALGLAVY
jgi:hypothetical protein